jgi:hypothetical protein
MSTRGRRGLLAVVAVAAVLALGLSLGAAAAPRCFGAAARDRVHPCTNPTKTVVPSVTDPHLHDDLPCKALPVPPAVQAHGVGSCAFGVSPARAVATVALVGDSHALHWRAALDVAAHARRWRGISVTTSMCFYSAAVENFVPDARARCTAWYHGVSAWLRAHPEIHTVFVSQNAPTPVVVGPGETYFGIKSRGFERAWTGLPKTVRHVVDIRDVPTSTNHLFDCVRDVAAAGKQQPGPACPFPRSKALRWDIAVATVRRLHSKRYQSVDLTEYFCDRRNCYLVVGGVLTNEDLDHINAVYSRTLGPYLLRKVSRLMRSW